MAASTAAPGRASTGGRGAASRGSGAKKTEPVSNKDEFLAFAKKVLELVDSEGVGVEEQLEQERKELTAKLGENIQVVSAARFERIDTGTIEGYAHLPANKLGVLVQLRGGSPELARKVHRQCLDCRTRDAEASHQRRTHDGVGDADSGSREREDHTRSLLEHVAPGRPRGQEVGRRADLELDPADLVAQLGSHLGVQG